MPLINRWAFRMASIVVLLCSAKMTQAQPCNLTGQWTGSVTFNLFEDAGGAITGSMYTSPTPTSAFTVTGTHTGSSLSLVLTIGASSFPVSDTLTSCDSMSPTGVPISLAVSRVSTSYCGDGVTDPGEECDDGNFANGDLCTIVCTAAACGNNVLEPGEDCDDGDAVNGDGCSTTCEVNVCGNGIPESGEQCDDSNLVNGDGCSTLCQTNICGNGTIESGEQCDDGNTTGGDSCSTLCQFEGCNLTGRWTGAATFNLLEDAGGAITGSMYISLNPGSGFQVTGTRTGTALSLVLSLGTLNVPVTDTLTSCDNMNPTGVPVSLAVTRVSSSYCGDGLTDPGEDCDDGNFVNGDLCTIICTPATCGNHIQEPGEECDDGNMTNGDGCSTTCEVNVCGNGMPESGEQCDDSNLVNGDGCSSTCQTNVCGNGTLESGEQCDDGNAAGGDGCSTLCQFEGCNVTGRWIGAYNWNLHEDAGGAITGNMYPASDPSTVLGVTGTRTGTALSLVLTLGTGGSFPVTDTLESCDSIDPSGVPVSLYADRVSTTYCGDGSIDAGEECDDGNFVNGDDCNVACALPFCGDGLPNPLEQCDDGNLNENDACRNNCRTSICGDGVLWAGIEACDEGISNSTAADALCRPDCTSRRCGDDVTDPASGEQCDDANALPGDGCDASCLTENIASGSIPPGGGTVTTDPAATGATPALPVQAAIVSPNEGIVTIVITSLIVPPPAGYELVGKEIDITAPPATVADPLRFIFEIDASVIPAGEDQNTLAVFRNGQVVNNCLGATNPVPDDPCVTERSLLASGNVELTVLTSHASLWTVGKRLPQSISGAKLLLKDNADPRKKGLTVTSQDVAISVGNGADSVDDPTINGGSVSVRTAAGCGGPCDDSYPLPKEHWLPANAGYRYVDKTRVDGPIKVLTFKAGKLIKLAAKGSALGHSLDSDPAPVTVTVRIGSQVYCMTFGGTTTFKDGSKFTAKAAPAESCP